MSYTVDGQFGSMVSEQQDRDASHHVTVDSVMILDEDNDIPLTGLAFTEISWRFALPRTFEDRAFLERDLGQVQYDSDISGYIGDYAPGSLWYTRAEGLDEGLEVHAGVDGAWWQLILSGLGRALFTNGVESTEVDLISGHSYTVTMGLNPDTGYASVTLTDGVDVLANHSASGLSIPLSLSHLGASGTVFNYIGGEEDATTISYAGESHVSGQYVGWDSQGQPVFNDFLLDQPYYFDTGPCGTTAGAGPGYYPWTTRPWWAHCDGMLDNVMIGHRTTCQWYKFSCSSIPAGFEDGYLEYVVDMQAYGGAWIGNSCNSRVNSQWPTYWGQGAATGGYAFYDTEWHARTFYAPVQGYVQAGGYFYIGVEMPEVSKAEYPPWYYCGFTWPADSGAGNSWRMYHNQPEAFRWVDQPVSGGALSVTVDEIYFGTVVVGESVTEEGEVAEGWNTEMVEVDGTFSIRATPVNGTVHVFSAAGELLDYGEEWEEVDDDGLEYRLIGRSDTVVTVTYFVSRPVFDQNKPIISRPWLIELQQNLARGVLTQGP